MRNKLIILVVAIVLFGIVSYMYILFQNDVVQKNNGVNISSASYEEQEKEKKKTTSADVESVKSQIIPLISKAKWKEAENYIEDFFETNSRLGQSAATINNYYSDLTILNQMSSVAPKQYNSIFTEFKAPETFIAAMVYYPASVKINGFLNYESLVPTTSTNELTIFSKEEIGSEIKEEMASSFDDFKSGEKYKITLDGGTYEVLLLKRENNTYGIWSIKSLDGNSYFMTVQEWEKNLTELQ